MRAHTHFSSRVTELYWIKSVSIVGLNLALYPAVYLLNTFTTAKYHFSEEENTAAAVLGHPDAINNDQHSLSTMYTTSYSIIKRR